MTYTPASSIDGQCDAGNEIIDQSLCEEACKHLTGNFGAGVFETSPRCFIVVSGKYKDNCHWNTNENALFYIDGRKAVCMANNSGHSGALNLNLLMIYQKES